MENQVSLAYQADFFLGPANTKLFSGSFSEPFVCTERNALVPVQTNAAYVEGGREVISEAFIANLYFSGIQAGAAYRWRGMRTDGRIGALVVRGADMRKAFLNHNSARSADRGYIARSHYAALATSSHDHESTMTFPWISFSAGYKFTPFFNSYFQAKWSFAPKKEDLYENVGFTSDPSYLKDTVYKAANGASRRISALALVPFKHSNNQIARNFKVHLSTQEKSSFALGLSLQPRSGKCSLDLIVGMQQTAVEVSLTDGQFAYPMVTTSYQRTFSGVSPSALWVSTIPVKFKESLWPFLFGVSFSFRAKKATFQLGCELYTVDSNLSITTPTVEETDDPKEATKKVHTYNIPYSHKPTRLRDLRDAQGCHMGAPTEVQALLASNVKISMRSFFLAVGWTF